MIISDELKEELSGNFPEFVEKTKSFFKKEIKPSAYKSTSGGYGCYGERGADSVMYRLRFSGGVIEKPQMRFLIDTIKDYSLDFLHFSTGESIQIQHLSGEEVIELFPKAHVAGIYTRGGGSDFPRNMTASPLHGITKNEAFDVTPYLNAARIYLLTLITKLNLPRKYKITFSSGKENDAHANFKDLGFIAKDDGTFDVYAAGGLGPNPRIATKVDEGVDPKKVLYYMHAMGRLYGDHGDHKNRAKARSRYIAARLGDDAFKKLFHEYLARTLKEEDLDIEPEVFSIKKKGDGKAPKSALAVPQRQEGLYYVQYHPFCGDPDGNIFRELLTYVEGLEAGELRLNTDESVYAINLTAEEADHVAKLVEKDTAKTSFDRSISCVGANVCQIGLRDSAGMLRKIREAVERAGVNKAHLPQIRISGCQNSCSAHQMGEIGFCGFTKKVKGKPVPSFILFIDGAHSLQDTHFGKQVGNIAMDDVPKFFVDLGEALDRENKDFTAWREENKSEFDALIGKYGA